MLNTKNSKRIEADILVTNDCNLSCEHCLYRNDYQNPRHITLKQFTLIEQFFAECDVDFHLLGGEPLCNPEIFSIVSHLEKCNKYKQILTNGVALDDVTLKKLVANGIGSIGFSLDGEKSAHDSNRGKGSYDNVITGIERCRRYNILPKVSTCVHSENYQSIKKMISELAQLGVKRLLFEYFVPFGNKHYSMKMLNQKEWSEFKNEVKEYNLKYGMRILAQKVFFEYTDIEMVNFNHCICANGQYPVIDVYGNYYPCILYYAANLNMLNIFRDSAEKNITVQQRIQTFCKSVFDTYYSANKRINYTALCPAYLYAISSENTEPFMLKDSDSMGCFHIVEQL